MPALHPPPSLVQGSVPALCLLAHTEGSGHSPPHLASAEVTDPASIKAAAASVGERLKGSGLNLLINNAGVLNANTLETETLKDMLHVYTTNTIAPLLLSQVMPSPTAPGTSLYCSPEVFSGGRKGPVEQGPPPLSACCLPPLLLGPSHLKSHSDILLSEAGAQISPGRAEHRVPFHGWDQEAG